MKKLIRIENLTHSAEKGLERISANINGHAVWFESSDVSLQASPEGFASLFVLPACAMGADLAIEAPLNSAWLRNVWKLLDIYRRWWRYPTIRVRGSGERQDLAVRKSSTALCFSGGVDSFFSLLRGGFSVEKLVFVHGYDIPLSDLSRMEAYQKQMCSVAEATGTQAVFFRTNLRELPIFDSVSWERTHGAALAAVGHFMGNTRRLLISSSHPYAFPIPWGSHWETDHLWASESIEIIHTGAELWRTQKLLKIADEPLVQRYLRVCWENRSSHLNCCQCEKCIRTMLVLLQGKKLDSFEVFNEKTKISQYIDRLPYVKKNLYAVYREFLNQDMPQEVKESLRLLLRRSRKEIVADFSLIAALADFIWKPIPTAVRQKIKRIVKI